MTNTHSHSQQLDTENNAFNMDNIFGPNLKPKPKMGHYTQAEINKLKKIYKIRDKKIKTREYLQMAIQTGREEKVLRQAAGYHGNKNKGILKKKYAKIAKNTEASVEDKKYGTAIREKQQTILNKAFPSKLQPIKVNGVTFEVPGNTLKVDGVEYSW